MVLMVTVCTAIKTGNPLLFQGAVSDRVESTSSDSTESDAINKLNLPWNPLKRLESRELEDYKTSLDVLRDITGLDRKHWLTVPMHINDNRVLYEFELLSENELPPDFQMLFASIGFSSITRFISSNSENSSPSYEQELPVLRDIELECIRWVAAGKTYEDVSDILNTSKRNVRYHLESARNKYGYATIMQTVVRVAKDYSLEPL